MNKNDVLSEVMHNELWRNETINNIVNSTIVEYDIHAAHLMAVKIIYGNKLYNELKNLDKTTRNIKIGIMEKEDPTLVKKLQDYLYKFKMEFIRKNNILINNIIETTKDSLVLCQKIPSNTIINVEGTDIEFRNKDGTYSSFYRLGTKSLLYDSFTGNLRIKGLGIEAVNNSDFCNLYLKNLLNTIETNISVGPFYCMKLMQQMRKMYIESDNINIYKSLEHKNKFVYTINDEIIETDVPITRQDAKLSKILNYKNFVMPLMATVI